MAQHWFKSSEYLDMKEDEINFLTEKEAHFLFAKHVKGWDGEQTCPDCGVIADHYWRGGMKGRPGKPKRPRNHWRCRACTYEFSATVGTVFQDHKLPIRTILRGLFSYMTSVKGDAALELRRKLGVAYQTAWLNHSKLREVLYRTRLAHPMTGVVQTDGGYFCGKQRMPNQHARGGDKRAEWVRQEVHAPRTPAARRARQFLQGGPKDKMRREKRRVVLVVREVVPGGGGAVRTAVTIVKAESAAHAVPFIRKYVELGTTVMSDEGHAYSELGAWYDHRTVRHSKEYVNAEGINDNQAESFISRFRRAEYGVFHRFEPTYLMDYATEMAWREDTRRFSMKQTFVDLLRRIGQAGRSRFFRGYFQGVHRTVELLNQ